MAMMSAKVIPRSPPNAAPANNRSKVRAVRRNAVFNVFIFVRLAATTAPLFVPPPSLYDRARAVIHLRAGLCFRRFPFKFHLVVFLVDVGVHFITWSDFAVKKLQRERVLNKALHRPFHRARAECGIVSFAEQERLGR